jgi:hypothetical protein
MSKLNLALIVWIALASTLYVDSATAQEPPYLVTYSHHLEEPGSLEVEAFTTIGIPRAGDPSYFAPYTELEYGLTGWWTTEAYAEALSRSGDSTVFTGYRWENRFLPFRREHWINPVLYFEFEDLNEASRIQKEIVGHSLRFEEPNSELRHDHARELEGKLILGSTVGNWNVSENFTVEKNLSEDEGLEFGYAFGISRPLGTLASAANCRLCRENFNAGIEIYGGLGSTQAFGLRDTSHYIAPVLAWQIGDNTVLHVSSGFGLTHGSAPVLLRFGYSYEMRGFGSKVAALFGRKP